VPAPINSDVNGALAAANRRIELRSLGQAFIDVVPTKVRLSDGSRGNDRCSQRLRVTEPNLTEFFHSSRWMMALGVTTQPVYVLGKLPSAERHSALRSASVAGPYREIEDRRSRDALEKYRLAVTSDRC
jgi:hypothetical protein